MGSIDIVTVMVMAGFLLIFDLFGLWYNSGRTKDATIFYFFSIMLGIIFIPIEATSSGVVITSTITTSPYPYTLALVFLEVVQMVLVFR